MTDIATEHGTDSLRVRIASRLGTLHRKSRIDDKPTCAWCLRPYPCRDKRRSELILRGHI